MSSPAFRRVLAQSTRRNMQRTQLSLRPGVRSTRRGMASSVGPEKSNDTVWLISAATVTIGAIAYILSPRSKKHAHQAAKAADAPLEHAVPKEGKGQSKPELMKDDEGNVADVSESMNRSLEADNPKDAKAAEEDAARFDDGARGQTGDAAKPEIKEKPVGTQRAGTLQDKPDGPTNLGDARQQAKEKNAPKEVAEKTQS